MPPEHPESGSEISDTRAGALEEGASAPSSLHICEDKSQRKSEAPKRDNPRMGKQRRDTPTREGLRFHWLIHQLERKGVNGAELARRTGVRESHINGFKNIETSRRTGIGAEMIRRMKDGVGLDPRYFFDDYEGERPHELYLLDAKREERRHEELMAKLSQISQRQLDIEVKLAQLAAQDARRDSRIDALESGRKPAPSGRQKRG